MAFVTMPAFFVLPLRLKKQVCLPDTWPSGWHLSRERDSSWADQFSAALVAWTGPPAVCDTA